MLAAVYCRVSTDEQKQNTSLGGQEDNCRHYAEMKGLDVYKVYRDDYTGSRMDRPALQELLTELKENRFHAIIVNEISRWGRDERVLLDLKYEILSNNTALHFVDWGKQVSFENPMENHMYSTMGSFAVMWRDIIRTNFREGKIKKASKMHKPVMIGHPPYGYRREGKRNEARMIIDEIESGFVQKIFTWFTRGDEVGQALSLRAIAAKLQAMNVPTPHFKKVSAQRWNPTTIKGILENAIYMGMTHYGKTAVVKDYVNKLEKRIKNPPEKWIEIPVPELAIIDKYTFEMAQDKARKAKNQALSNRNRKNQYLLVGFFHCSGCEFSMNGNMTRSRGHPGYYYRCGNRWHMKGNKPCTQIRRSLNTEKTESLVWDWITGLWSNDAALEEGIIGLREARAAELQPKITRVERVKFFISEQEKKAQRLITQLSGIDDPEISAMIKKQAKNELDLRNDFAKELKELQADINQIDFSPEAEENLKIIIQRVRSGLANPSYEVKRRIFDWINLVVYYREDETGKWLDVKCGLSDGVIALCLSPTT